MEAAIYRLSKSFGRGGDLEGIFVAEKQQVEILIDEDIVVYFGEIFGKHSEVYTSFDWDDIQVVSESEEAIRVVNELGLYSGYNPFDETVLDFDYEQYYVDEDLDNVEDIVNAIIKNKLKTK